MDVRGKVVLITGARRIGLHVGHKLAEQGAKVAITYHKAKDLEENAAGMSLRCYQVDVAYPESVRGLFAAVDRELGTPDILINMASVFNQTPFEKLSEKDFDDAVSVDLKGSYLCSLEFARHAKQGGLIINFSDVQSLTKPYAGRLPYHVAKGAVKILTEALAVELAPRIRVNAIAPGPILPPQGLSKERADVIEKNVPLKRWGGAEEIAKAVLYLIGADFVTGETLYVDGGVHMAGDIYKP